MVVGDPLRAALGLDRAAAALPTTITTRYAALVENQRLRVDRIANGSVMQERLVALPGPVAHWAWRDANEIVIVGGDRRIHTYRVDANALVEVARPAARWFERPGSADLERLDRDDGLVVTAAGDTWLHHCVWGYRGDEDPCVVDVHVRIVPGSPQRSTTAPVARRAATLAAPANIALALGADEALQCTRDGTTTTIPAPETLGFSLDDVQWLSHRPPLAIVHAMFPGADDAVAVPRVLVGCELAANVEPVVVARGAHALWAILDDDAMVVLWHGRPIARLVGATDVRFAP